MSLVLPLRTSPQCGASKGEEPEKLPEPPQEESQVLHGTGHCKWFNVRMGFGFISMINREGDPLDIPVDVFVHQSKLFMEGFRSLKEGEPVEFTFKKSPKGLESIRVTGPGGSPCLGSERRPKGKTQPKRKPKGDRWRRQDLLMDQMWTVREEESRMIPRRERVRGKTTKNTQMKIKIDNRKKKIIDPKQAAYTQQNKLLSPPRIGQLLSEENYMGKQFSHVTHNHLHSSSKGFDIRFTPYISIDKKELPWGKFDDVCTAETVSQNGLSRVKR
ncbi:putative protein lin-28-like protein [Cricetulus griseus]|nr:putative protein lin-28-like protein [Cricetulus griseus]